MGFFRRLFGGKRSKATSVAAAPAPAVSAAPVPPPPPPPPPPTDAVQAALLAAQVQTGPAGPAAPSSEGQEEIEGEALVVAEEVAGVATPVRILLSDGSAASLPEDDELHARLKYLADNLIPPKKAPRDT